MAQARAMAGIAGTPYFVATMAAMNCVTEATAAKEISIPPDTSTTKTPAARIVVTE